MTLYNSSKFCLVADDSVIMSGRELVKHSHSTQTEYVSQVFVGKEIFWARRDNNIEETGTSAVFVSVCLYV
jgi:hypothetical protein